MHRLRLLPTVLLGVLALFFLTSGPFFVIDRPRAADVIVVLAGEADRRPARGLELLQEKYAPRMILDVSLTRVYGTTMVEIANNYLKRLPAAEALSICPIVGLSTKAETKDLARCLRQWPVHRVLLVTSDYHTRRAFLTFAHELHEYQFSVAAAYDAEQFGPRWWKHRQWAKLNIDEWLRLLWWQSVDRWRS